jgi:magnesium and cobalt transporter
MDDAHSKPSLLERLSTLLMREPEDREQLIDLLRSAYDRNLLDSDALAMIEGVLQVSEMQARDIMVPRAQMDVIDIGESPDQFIPMVIQTAHSRFPVIGENKDDVIGILLAKDLLRHYAGEEEFNVRDMLRPAVFIPEAKPLNVLLKEFRKNRNHIAIVVDEYGGVAGLVTIEDVLEQIVGDIEDEYDFDEVEDNIIQEKGGQYRVKALTEIGDFNAAFGTEFSDEEFDTVGGLVLKRFGRVPKRGEQVSIDGLVVKVLRGDSRRVHLLQVSRKAAAKG